MWHQGRARLTNYSGSSDIAPYIKNVLQCDVYNQSKASWAITQHSSKMYSRS